jgi:hypothetical protein
MTVPWRQIVAQDPNPSNQTPGGGNMYIQVPPATLAGNPLLVHSNMANLVGSKVISVTQMIAGSGTSLTKIDELLNPGSPPGTAANAGCHGAVWHLPNPAAMSGGDKGTTTAGSTTSITDSSKSGVWTTNQWQGKWVKCYNRGQMAQVTSSTSTGVINFNSGQIGAAAGDLYVVGDWLEMACSPGVDDYNGGIMLELDATQGIPTTAIGALHSAFQVPPGSTVTAGADAITTGSANLGTGTVIQIGFFENDVDSASSYVPNVGSSGTDGGTFYIFNLGQPIMRVIYRTLLNPGTTDMKATAQTTDHFQAFMVGFPLANISSPGPMPRQIYVMP